MSAPTTVSIIKHVVAVKKLNSHPQLLSVTHTRCSIFFAHARASLSLGRKHSRRRGKAREQTLFLIHTGHYLRQCCAINTAVEPIKRTARGAARHRFYRRSSFFFFLLFVDDIHAAWSRATAHVPINEARRGEEPERIGGLVFKGEGDEGRKRRLRKVRRERTTKVACKRRPTLKAPRGRVNNNPWLIEC